MRILRLLLLVLAALLALAAGTLSIYAWRALPALDGELRAPGLAAPVQVRRDAADVTHIEAQSFGDAAFAIGYLHAQERSWQLEFNRRVMHGLLSEAFGPATLDTDRLLRRLGIMRAAQAQWERLPADVQRQLDAYARGINAFQAAGGQALPPEFHITGVRPGAWTGKDCVGWSLMMALDLGGNWGTEFARLALLQRLSTEQLWQIMPSYGGEPVPVGTDLAALYRGLGVYRAEAPARARTASAYPALDSWADGLGHLEGIGSNSWVVAGNRTPSGKPLLANDPHLGLSAPAIWYFARLKAPAAPGGKPLDVIGATLPGLPMVVLGRTAGVAWTFTNTGADAGEYYDLPKFLPFWERASDLGVPVYLHPRGTLPSQQRIYEGHGELLGPAWAFGVETATHALRLITAGLFDRFPKLTMILGHLGEGLVPMIWRTQNRFNYASFGKKLEKPLARYLPDHFYITTSGNFHTPTLKNVIEEMGVDRVMFSVDYPYETNEQAVSWFDSCPIGEAAREKIGRTNAERLFKLDPAPAS